MAGPVARRLVLLWLALSLVIAPAARAAFPAVAGTATSTTTGNSNSHTINLPASIAAGNLLLACGAFDFDPGLVTWASGWTNIIDTDGGITLNVWYRIADGTEGASISVTSGNTQRSAWLTYLITNWHGTTPPEAATPVANGNPPSVTASWGSAENLFVPCVTADGNSGDTSALSLPTNYTNLLEADSGNTSGGVTAFSARRALSAASDDPGAFGGSPQDAPLSTTIVIRPAAAGGGEPAGVNQTIVIQ